MVDSQSVWGFHRLKVFIGMTRDLDGYFVLLSNGRIYIVWRRIGQGWWKKCFVAVSGADAGVVVVVGVKGEVKTIDVPCWKISTLGASIGLRNRRSAGLLGHGISPSSSYYYYLAVVTCDPR